MSYRPKRGRVANRAVYALAQFREEVGDEWIVSTDLAARLGVDTRGLAAYLYPAIRYGVIEVKRGHYSSYRLAKGFVSTIPAPPPDSVSVRRPNAPSSVWQYAERMAA